jgi:hypothetical protein
VPKRERKPLAAVAATETATPVAANTPVKTKTGKPSPESVAETKPRPAGKPEQASPEPKIDISRVITDALADPGRVITRLSAYESAEKKQRHVEYGMSILRYALGGYLTNALALHKDVDLRLDVTDETVSVNVLDSRKGKSKGQFAEVGYPDWLTSFFADDEHFDYLLPESETPLAHVLEAMSASVTPPESVLDPYDEGDEDDEDDDEEWEDEEDEEDEPDDEAAADEPVDDDSADEDEGDDDEDDEPEPEPEVAAPASKRRARHYTKHHDGTEYVDGVLNTY